MKNMDTKPSNKDDLPFCFVRVSFHAVQLTFNVVRFGDSKRKKGMLSRTETSFLFILK